MLRRNYPDIPIMALTATANEKVIRKFFIFIMKVDVISVLRIPDCVRFVQSFNRKNLRYEVKPKGKSVDEDIYAFVNSHYPGKSGIVYCTSRTACEEMADKLTVVLNV
jgi:superfamily II DNA helicase RecQ